MTLIHEATWPRPEGPQPDTARALQVVLRELDRVLVPELQSDHARSTAGMLGQLLRHLILRETQWPHRLDEWTSEQRTLLAEAGIAAGDCGDGSPHDRNQSTTEIVAPIAANRAACPAGGAGAAVTDEWTRRAIAAEREHFATCMRLEIEMPYLESTSDRAATLAVTPERLGAYFATKIPHRAGVAVTKCPKLLGGFSKETFMIDMEVDGQAMPVVMRRDIALGPVAGSVADEIPLLRVLRESGIPVPEPVLAEADRDIFGEAFSITRRATGETAFSNIRGLEMSGDQSHAARGLAMVLGRLHRLDPASLALPDGFFDARLSMSDCVMREIDHYERAWLTRSHHPSPTVSAAFAWLRANMPPPAGRPCIVHGDAGLHNLMMDGEKISAMLDWELTHMGDPLEDLAYCRTWVDQALPWDQFLDVYYRSGGFLHRPEYEKFYRILSNLRVVVFTAQAAYGSHWSEHPELTLMFSVPRYHVIFLDKVAKELLE